MNILHFIFTDRDNEISEYDQQTEHLLWILEDENGNALLGHENEHDSLMEAYLRDHTYFNPYFPGEE